MLKPDDPAAKKLDARLRVVASAQYVGKSLFSVGDTTFWTMSGGGTPFDRLTPAAQLEVVNSLVDWGLYKDQGLSDTQARVIFDNVRAGKSQDKWLEGIFDEAALESQRVASFNTIVEDRKNSPANYMFDELDGSWRSWSDLSAPAKLQYIALDAARCNVPFEPFAQAVRGTIGDMGEAALRVVLEGQKQLHAIQKLLPDDGREEPTPVVEQVKEILDYVAALEAQERERLQGREKLLRGISDVLDGKTPQGWSEAAKALRDVFRGEQAKAQEVRTQERGRDI